jgi:hypothetical protein
MARRGRFGRAEAGSSNLSSLIQQLIREQKAAEERLLLDSFYNKTPLYGSIPTLDNVIDFYKELAELGGFEENSMEYQALLQKIGAATNFDIDEQYTDLVNEFNTTRGGNYEQLLDFLGTRATTSTDQGNLDKYSEQLEELGPAYLGHRGNDMVDGLITPEEFRSIADSVISSIPDDNPNKVKTIIDSYTFEWTKLSQQYKDRVTGGTMSLSKYINWAEGFQKKMVSAGVPASGALFDAIGADIAVQKGSLSSGGVPGGPVGKKKNKVVRELSDLWATITGQVGSDQRYGYEDMSESELLSQIKQNPEYSVLFSQMIDEDSSLIPASLRDRVETGEDFLAIFEAKLYEGYALSNNLNAMGVSSDTKNWLNTNYAAGSLGILSYTKATSVNWAADRNQPGISEVDINFYDSEYEKYLSGQPSFYGQININMADSVQKVWIDNELNRLLGGGESGQTISGYQETESDMEKNNSYLDTAKATKEIADKVKSGQLIEVWVEDSSNAAGGSFEAMEPLSAGFGTGQYQHVELRYLPDGSDTYAHSVLYKGKPILDENGEDTGYFAYKIPGRGLVAIDGLGEEYDITGVRPDIDGNYRMPEGTSSLEGVGKAERVNVSLLEISLTPRNLQGLSGDSSRERRANGNRKIADIIRKDADKIAAASLAIDPRQQPDVQTEIANLSQKANEYEAKAIAIISEGRPLSANQDAAYKAQIARLTGTPEEQAFWQGEYVKYEEVSPGLYRLKPEYKEGPKEKENPIFDAVRFVSPLAGLALDAAGALGDFAGIGSPQSIKDFRSQEEKNKSRVPIPFSSESYLDRSRSVGGANVGVAGATFFRNVSPVNQGPGASINAPQDASSYLRSAAPIIKPKAPVITPTQLQGVSGDSSSERRLRALRNPPIQVKPLSQPQPLPRPIIRRGDSDRGGV